MSIVMKRELTDLLRDRFEAHEAPVDPGTWEAIRSTMSAPVAAQDPLNELFRQRFEEHVTDVDPGVWQQIGSQLGHVAPAAPAASSWGIGWAAASAVALVLGGAILFSTQGDKTIDEQVVAEVRPTQVASVPDEIPAPIDAAETQVKVEMPSGKTAAEVQQNDNGSAPLERRLDRTAEVPPPDMMEATQTAVTPAGPAPGIPVQEDGKALVEQILEELTTEAEKAAKSTDTAKEPPVATVVPPTVEELRNDAVEAVVPAPLPKLFLPNTFTPNGDGVNDEYEVGAQDFKHVMVRVFSVKGDQLVFSTNTGEKWTGANCEDGYYLVAVEALTHDGRTVTEGKVVWLARTR